MARPLRIEYEGAFYHVTSNGSYTTYFNVKRNRSGHLFEGRYKAIVADKDEYAGELSRYIHLNPVRAKMTERPEDYEWLQTYGVCPNIELDEFMVMPNHVHGIIVIVGAQFIAPIDCDAINQNKKPGAINHAPTIGEIVRSFKALCTHAINQTRNTPGHPVWQRNYYERVIRDGNELKRIRDYVIHNPLKWESDEDNPIQLQIHGAGCR
jgi:REP element-mobilizing transposase RayT